MRKILFAVISVLTGIIAHTQIKISDESDNQSISSDSILILHETVISHKHEKSTLNPETVNSEFLQTEFSGSLAKSLEKIPGIQSMEIGSGSSKPFIRGLGFNRILVTENGIKQEGQQWGADHGLEINPWSIDEIQIIKGAAAMEFGSEAMGGVIAIRNSKPLPDTFSADWFLFGRTANQTYGSALNIQHRKQNFYYKISANYTDFADYSVPTDYIIYRNQQIPVYNQRLKNTAGNEYSFSTRVGYVSQEFESVLSLSNYYQKTGFYPGSHGIPTLEEVKDDGNSRNIELPYQNVNHFKILSENTLKFKPNTLKLSFGFQQNHRQEWSLFHTHYGDHSDEDNSNLELDFLLSTFDAQLKYTHSISSKNKINLGFQSQSQKNSIKGYSFLLPEFSRFNLGSFISNEWEINSNWMLNYGVRYDYFKLEIQPYFDSVLYEFLMENGNSSLEAEIQAQRSIHLEKEFHQLNTSLGILYQPNSVWDFNLNLGTSFRTPTALELASNGIHHGSFRHEQGNPDLEPEKGWVSDLKISFHPQDWHIELNPYFYYFSNYIFLEPSGIFSPLPDGGQIYKYNQSEAILTGAEFKIEKRFFEKLNAFASVEFLYNQQIHSEKSQNYPLPLSPPMKIYTQWDYEFVKNKGFLENLHLSFDVKMVSKQDRIARNEEITNGYTILGAGIHSKLRWKSFQMDLIFKAENLADKNYFNHMSYYRALEIPEMGRNFQMVVKIPLRK